MYQFNLTEIYIIEEFNKNVDKKTALKWLIDHPMCGCLLRDKTNGEVSFLRFNDEHGSFQNRGSHWSEEQFPGDQNNEYFLHDKSIIDL